MTDPLYFGFTCNDTANPPEFSIDEMTEKERLLAQMIWHISRAMELAEKLNVVLEFDANDDNIDLG